MRLPEAIEKSGYFWLLSSPENKLPGTLRISESGATTLEIIGVFGDTLAALNDDNFDLNRVVGLIEDGKLVTLERCIYQNKSISFGGISKSTICVNFAFVGVGYDESEEVKFSRLDFSVEGLDEWLGISGIKVEHSDDYKSTSLRYTPPEKIAFQLPSGMALEFIFGYTLPGSRTVIEAKITQKAYVSLNSKMLLPIDDYLDVVFKINNFLCFATDETVSLDSITCYSNKITREISNGEKREIAISVYYESYPYTEVKPEITWHKMLFRYGHVANELEKILANWLVNYQVSEPAFNLYFSSKSGAHKYLEGRFLSLAQGIETLHRRNSNDTLMSEDEFNNLVDLISKACPSDKIDWLHGKLKYANELVLRQRIKQMIEPFQRFFGCGSERKSFIGKVIDTRNFLTHYDPRLAEQAANGKELWELCMKLEGLFQLHLLRMIKMDDNLITSLIKENRAIRNKLKLDPGT